MALISNEDYAELYLGHWVSDAKPGPTTATAPPKPATAANVEAGRRKAMYEYYRKVLRGINEDPIMKEMNKMAEEINIRTRIVRAYIVDPTPDVPIESRLLYRGEEVLTEDTNGELFYSIPVEELLAKHNALQARTLDKKATIKLGKDVFLEPIKIRDLLMKVVDIACF